MDPKKVLFAVSAAMIMILAATLVPAVNSNETDTDDYIVNTVEVKDQFQSYLDSLNDQAKERMTHNVDDCSYSLNTSVYEMYGEQEYGDAPIALTFSEDGVTSDYDPEIPEGITSTNENTTYDLIYDENGNIYDITITIDGQDYSARDLYDPVDNCMCTVMCAEAIYTTATVATTVGVSTGWIPFIGAIITLIVIIVVIAVVEYQYHLEHYADTDEGKVYIDNEEDVVDGIKVGKKNGNIVAISILGQDYKVSEKYKNCTDGKNNNSYYFALKCYGFLYIFPKVITEAIAKDVINLNKEKYNTFTWHSNNAMKICINESGKVTHHTFLRSGDYLPHYHKYISDTRSESAHSFYKE